jgi:ectoine hydroxylase-related dioxygenase (phytanoyl-CoA dioxygenase family)
VPNALTGEQVAEFRETGCLTVAGVVADAEIARLNEDLRGWIEESRRHDGPFGETLDGRPRFDVQPGHSAAAPALRRVQSPTEISDAYLALLTGSAMIEMLADLIGPDLRLHHSKVNCKLPDSGTEVGWHQDFAFDPHTNDDMVACLVFLDEVTAENGPLKTVPGSHRGPIHSLWQKGRFTGAVAPAIAAGAEAGAVSHRGPAGSVCFMHSRVLHGSAANRSGHSRNLFIAQIAAADAKPLVPNHLPSVHEGLLLRGAEPNRIRAVAFEIEVPEIPETTFFDQQAAEIVAEMEG